jgi:hypothetical protein
LAKSACERRRLKVNLSRLALLLVQPVSERAVHELALNIQARIRPNWLARQDLK